MTDSTTGDVGQQKKLKVTAVKAAQNCVGPMIFEIIWKCERCLTQNSFEKRYSMLPPQHTVCTNCGTTYQYVYPHEYFKKIYDGKTQLAAFEERLFRKIYGGADTAWISLGKNLFFVISSQVLSGKNAE